MLYAALFLGFIGSLHCVVMCGPIAMALAGQQTLSKFLLSRLVYNSGRIFTYALLGLVIGLLGELVSLGGYQQAFSIIIGCLLVLLGFLWTTKAKNNLYQPFYKLTAILKGRLAHWLKATHLKGAFLLGALNGLLPCGLVYAAIAGALASANFVDGTLYMLVFGLGTFPAMIAMALSGKFIKIFSFLSLHKLSTIFIFTLGAILIIRGMNLDIPYLSPAISFLYPTADITVCD